MCFFKKVLAVFTILIMTMSMSFAENRNASSQLNITIPEYINITPITSPVLTANITDRTGDLHTNLSTIFRVISNSTEDKTLYLKANIVTQDGYEEAMFQQGNQVYVAFGNLTTLPKSTALQNCKLGGNPNKSPGVVAYPVLSVTGSPSYFNKSKNKYEVKIENGTTDIAINIGANILKTSFGSNDPKGFYQTIISLTESDI